MKTKIPLLILLFLSLSSCIKDYLGDGPKNIKLTEENHLYVGDLLNSFAKDEIPRLEDIIANANGSFTKDEIQAAKNELQSLNTQLANIPNIYINQDIPRPCPNDPGGKCVPVRLEFFVYPPNVQEALMRVTAENSGLEGVSNDLQPLSGNQSGLQFIRLPIEDVDAALTIEVEWKDLAGNRIAFKIILEN